MSMIHRATEAVEGKWTAAKTCAHLQGLESYPGAQAWSLVYSALCASESFAWDPRLLDALMDSANSLPADTAYHAETMPDRLGWIWFGLDSHIGLDEVDPDTDLTVRQIRVVALNWASFEDSPTPTSWNDKPAHLGGGPGVGLIVWLKVDDDAALKPVFVESVWREGQTLADYETGESVSGRQELDTEFCTKMLRLVVAAGLWMRQTIVDSSDSQLNRHARKRLDRDAPDDFNRRLRIITLRRIDQSEKQDDYGKPEWSCQWVVSGHWRQQFYRSTGRRSPIWINAYVKGPDDKPLKSPAERVFAVIR